MMNDEAELKKPTKNIPECVFLNNSIRDERDFAKMKKVKLFLIPETKL